MKILALWCALASYYTQPPISSYVIDYKGHTQFSIPAPTETLDLQSFLIVNMLTQAPFTINKQVVVKNEHIFSIEYDNDPTDKMQWGSRSSWRDIKNNVVVVKHEKQVKEAKYQEINGFVPTNKTAKIAGYTCSKWVTLDAGNNPTHAIWITTALAGNVGHEGYWISKDKTIKGVILKDSSQNQSFEAVAVRKCGSIDNKLFDWNAFKQFLTPEEVAKYIRCK